MRTVTYGAACSLDGYLTDPAGQMDWLHFSPDAQEAMQQSWAGVDAVLMGRKTWEFAAAQGGGGARPGVTTYLFSRTRREQPAGVELVASDAGVFVRDLRTRPGGRNIVMGGGELAQALFAADLIDEVELNVHPVLLGGGAPMFRDAGRRVALELVEQRALDGGCVLARYRVRR